MNNPIFIGVIVAVVVLIVVHLIVRHEARKHAKMMRKFMDEQNKFYDYISKCETATLIQVAKDMDIYKDGWCILEIRKELKRRAVI